MPNPYRDTITLWRVTGKDVHNQEIFSSPQAIPGRWEDLAEQFLNMTNEVEISRAVVKMPKEIGEDINIGDYLFLGVSNEASPRKIAQAFRIRQVVRLPDLRSVRTEFRMML